MMKLENISSLQWLYVLPVFWVVAWLFAKRTREKLNKVINSRLLPFLVSSVSFNKRRWKIILQSLVILFLVVALARPQMGKSVQEVKSQGFELMLVLDVSESMMAEDVKPNRLEQVKAEMTRLMDMLAGSKIGIIAFAGTAVLISPLTSDPAALKMYIESLATNSVSSQGTHFETALRVAKDAFERGGADKDSTHAVTRAILVSSDGEDHEPGALKFAEEMAKSGTRIYSLAYGTEKGGPIPARDKMGFLRGYKKFEGQTIITSVKGEELQKLAKAGKGSFYFASFGGDHLRRLVEDFDQLEKSEFESQVATQYEENFQFFLLIAIFLGLIELALGERRSDFKIWRGRFEAPGVISLAGALLIYTFSLAVPLQPAFASEEETPPEPQMNFSFPVEKIQSMFHNVPHLRTLLESRLGKKAVMNQNLSEAQEHFINALTEDPFLSLNHSNLGLVFDVNQQAEKAMASYRKALELAEDPMMKFVAHFNLAQLLGRKGDLDLALQEYQQALEIIPSSKEVKVNIELLIQKQQQQQQNQEGQKKDSKEGGQGQGQDNAQDKSQDNSSDKNNEKDKNPNKDQEKNQDKKKDSPKKYQSQRNYQPRPFNGKELSEGDVKKILGELKQQEQKIRANYYNKEMKESPHGKDW